MTDTFSSIPFSDERKVISVLREENASLASTSNVNVFVEIVLVLFSWSHLQSEGIENVTPRLLLTSTLKVSFPAPTSTFPVERIMVGVSPS